jgi:Flp pilus assembly protein TadD/cell division septation protein DedD
VGLITKAIEKLENPEGVPPQTEIPPSPEETTAAAEEAVLLIEKQALASKVVMPSPEESGPSLEQTDSSPEEVRSSPKRTAISAEERVPSAPESAPSAEEATLPLKKTAPPATEAVPAPKGAGSSPQGTITSPQEAALSQNKAASSPGRAPPALKEGSPPPRPKRGVAVLAAACLVIAALLGAGYVFLVKPKSEVPQRLPGQSLSAKREALKAAQVDSERRVGAEAGEVTGGTTRKEPATPDAAEGTSGAKTAKPQSAERLVKAEPLSASPGGFAVQVSASSDKKVAENIVSQMIAGGYKAYLQETEVPGEGSVYRVRIGAFDSHRKALATKEEIANRYGMEGWIDNYSPGVESKPAASSKSMEKVLVPKRAAVKAGLADSSKADQGVPGDEASTVVSERQTSASQTESGTAQSEIEVPPELTSFSSPGGERRIPTEAGPSEPQEATTAEHVAAEAGPFEEKQKFSEEIPLTYGIDSEAEVPKDKVAITGESDSRAQRYYNKGILYQKQLRFDLAVESYRKALSFNPDHQQARLNLATAYIQIGRLKEAERELTYLYAKNPDDPRILFNLGLLWHKFGDYVSAEAKLRRVLELDPFHLETNLLLASIYEEWGEKNLSLEYCTRAYRINSADPRVLYRLGRAWDMVNEPTEAVKYYRLFLNAPSGTEEGLKMAVRHRLDYLVSQQGEGK